MEPLSPIPKSRSVLEDAQRLAGLYPAGAEEPPAPSCRYGPPLGASLADVRHGLVFRTLNPARMERILGHLKAAAPLARWSLYVQQDAAGLYRDQPWVRQLLLEPSGSFHLARFGLQRLLALRRLGHEVAVVPINPYVGGRILHVLAIALLSGAPAAALHLDGRMERARWRGLAWHWLRTSGLEALNLGLLVLMILGLSLLRPLLGLRRLFGRLR